MGPWEGCCRRGNRKLSCYNRISRAKVFHRGYGQMVCRTERPCHKGSCEHHLSPHVLASDNQEAKIDVSREIPVASGQTTVSANTTLSETTIEYRDTGVILSVIPHINERGLVTMDISQEVSDLDADVNVANKNYPSFFKRTVKTTLTVKHGQTIVIGGLIRDKEEEDISGVPCLIDVPVVRYMFGYETKKRKRSS